MSDKAALFCEEWKEILALVTHTRNKQSIIITGLIAPCKSALRPSINLQGVELRYAGRGLGS